MKVNIHTEIISSLLDRPDEWKFDTNPTYPYIKHKSGFELSFMSNSPEVFSPDWAKGIKFSLDESKMLVNIIVDLKKERDNKTQGQAEQRVANMLNKKSSPSPYAYSSDKPWWKFW